jgi:hypothetical protein
MPDAYIQSDHDAELGAALRALPLLAPPRSALPELHAALAGRRRQQPLRWLAPLAAAAVLLIALVPLLQRQTASPDVAAVNRPSADAALERLIEANNALEARLAVARNANVAQDGDAAQASAEMEDLVAMVDGALNSSPDRDASVRLWQRRLSLLEALNQIQTRGSLGTPNADNGAVHLASL